MSPPVSSTAPLEGNVSVTLFWRTLLICPVRTCYYLLDGAIVIIINILVWMSLVQGLQCEDASWDMSSVCGQRSSLKQHRHLNSLGPRAGPRTWHARSWGAGIISRVCASSNSAGIQTPRPKPQDSVHEQRAGTQRREESQTLRRAQSLRLVPHQAHLRVSARFFRLFLSSKYFINTVFNYMHSIFV